jgi:plasmid stability protein
MATLTIRNLADVIYAKLKMRAAANSRSIEEEARRLIEEAVESEASLTYRWQAASRLRTFLARINSGGRRRQILPSNVAELLGHSGAGMVEDWFAAREEPKFADLYAIAALFCANGEWLAHGQGVSFTAEYADFPSGSAGFKDLIASKPNKIYLLRAAHEEGWLTIILKMDEYRYKTLRTSINVSEHIGSGGEGRLVAFTNLCGALWRFTSGTGLEVYSYILPVDDYLGIAHGEEYPGAVIGRNHSRPWWEDIWDFNRLGPTPTNAGEHYWRGFDQLRHRIRSCIRADKSDRADREWASTFDVRATAQEYGYAFNSIGGRWQEPLGSVD